MEIDTTSIKGETFEKDVFRLISNCLSQDEGIVFGGEFEKIAELYIEQLKTIFEYVTEEPLVLYNSRKTPIFHFACASNNSTAIKIASQIINKKQSK